MKKKLLVPLILFLSITIAFLVQLKRNAQGEDIKALESALVGKPVPAKNLTELFENKAYTNCFNKVSRFCLMCGRLGVRLVMPNINI